jgi:hypothetical protein
MKREHSTQQIRIWSYNDAPAFLREAMSGSFAWIAVLPATVVSADIEAFFTRWHSADNPVVRTVLSDGSVVLAGTDPSATEMFASTFQNLAKKRSPRSVSPSRDLRDHR